MPASVIPSKREALLWLKKTLHPASTIGFQDWEKIFAIVLLYPEPARSVIIKTDISLYNTYFRHYYDALYNRPALFDQCRILPGFVVFASRFPVFELEEVPFAGEASKPQFPKVKYHIRLEWQGIPVSLELDAKLADMGAQTTAPFRCITSSGPHIPYFSNPLGWGYIGIDSRFRYKGAQYLCTILEEILSMQDLALKDPAGILGLYTLCYQRALEKNEQVQYGKINIFDHFETAEWLNKTVLQRYHFSMKWAGEMLINFQNLINNHPELFNNPFN